MNTTNWRTDEDNFKYKILWLSSGEIKKGLCFHIENSRLFYWNVEQRNKKLYRISDITFINKFKSNDEIKKYVDEIMKLDVLVRTKHLMKIGVTQNEYKRY
jgi:hypothetical protein